MAKPGSPVPTATPSVSEDAPPEGTEGERTTNPEIGSLPPGVAMHDAGVLPNTTDRARFMAPDPKRPPPGWKGTFSTCGGCGDFIGNADRCPKCAPAMPSNVVNGGP